MLPILNLPPKTVNEIQYFTGINWGARFQSGEYITSSVWNVPNGLEVRSVGLSQEYSSVALITVAGGLAQKVSHYQSYQHQHWTAPRDCS